MSIQIQIFYRQLANIHFPPTQFAKRNLNDQGINKWIGPYKSAYGHHLVLIRNTNPGYYPPLTEVLDKVELNLLTAKKEESLKRFLDEVKSEYKVIINPNLKF